ncbi:MAG TPA: hypothetical protein PKH77_12050 [Anaerolineae bacterium]|nr:hypothetical protein [Anaerolineae bacterium]
MTVQTLGRGVPPARSRPVRGDYGAIHGQPFPDGNQGESVFTTLTRQGMPLIRYRTGDVGCFIPGPCPCGTSLKTLAHVTLRRDNVVRLPNGDTLALPALQRAVESGALRLAIGVAPAGVPSPAKRAFNDRRP